MFFQNIGFLKRSLQSKAEGGNVLFIILICVALFGALGFAIGSGRDNLSRAGDTEETRLTATNIVQYGNTLSSGMQKLIRIAAAEDTNANSRGIIFAASGANAAYGTVGSQPATELFHSNGGGLIYAAPPPAACVTSICAYEFVAQYNIAGVGTAALAEVTMVLVDVQEDVCKLLNSVAKSGLSAIPTGGALTLTRFNGTTYYDSGPSSIALAGGFSGKKAFCYKESSGAGRYIYVHVIRAR